MSVFVVIISILILQVFLSKCKSKIWGLILPILFSIPSLFGAFLCLTLARQNIGIMALPLAIYCILIYNIPSCILYLIYKKVRQSS